MPPSPLQELVVTLAENTAATEAHTAALDRHTEAEVALHRDVAALMGRIDGRSEDELGRAVARAEMLATLVRWVDAAAAHARESEAMREGARWAGRTAVAAAGALGATLGAVLSRHLGWW